MPQRQNIKQRKKRKRPEYCKKNRNEKHRRCRRERTDTAYLNPDIKKQEPIDFGHKKEILVTMLINVIACYTNYPWLIAARQSNKIEDAEGKDVIVHTTKGEFYLQIKSTTIAGEKFTKTRHCEKYKKMYLITSPDKKSLVCYKMPSPNEKADKFIIILVVYRDKNKTEEIEKLKTVFKKIKIALSIINQNILKTEKKGKAVK
jgi:hypothetical protein